MGVASRREKHGDVERLLFARTVPGFGPVYWASCYRLGGVVLDAGIVHARREFETFLDEKPTEAVLATHEHEDHVGNFAVLARHGVKGFAPQGAVDLLARIAAGRTARLPTYRAIAWGNHEGATDARVANGTVKAAGRSIRLIATPGHSVDHVALLDEESGAMFTGDAVLGKLKVCRAVEDVPTQMRSLRVILDADPSTVFPAHGPVLDHPREQVAAVLAYLEDVQRRAHALAAKGVSPRRIAREILGREGFMTYYSGREFSKENLVRSLLSREAA